MSDPTTEPQWFFCLKHHAVEPQDGCRSLDRLGPYPTADAASQALAKSAERNEAFDNDPAWNDDADLDGDVDEDDRGWRPLG